MTPTSSSAIAAFRALHVPGDPLILVNIWDAGSAKAVAAAGARAIATGSYGVAGAQGCADGENFPLDDVLENLRRILDVTDLPVTIDMESGYGTDPAAVGASITRAREAGAAGVNIEDRLPGASELLPIAAAQARYHAAADTGLFVNARCDSFRGRDAAADGAALVALTLERARAPIPTRAPGRCSCPSSPTGGASVQSAKPRRYRSTSSARPSGRRMPNWRRSAWRGSATVINPGPRRWPG